mgnify:CR=1 FL=1
MEKSFVIIRPLEADMLPNPRLEAVLPRACTVAASVVLTTAGELNEWYRQGSAPGAHLLWVIDLGRDGINLEYTRMLRLLRSGLLLDGTMGAMIIDAQTELYTKSTAEELALALNHCGCALVGRSLVEGTASLENFRIAARNLGTDNLLEAYCNSAAQLVKNLLHFTFPLSVRPQVTMLHASNPKRSNTLALAMAVEKRLAGVMDFRVIGLRNGTLYDCSGCPYEVCLHFGEKNSCVYGGIMVKDVYPSILESEAILMVCPNYNDALTANITGCINRLTALYRKRAFYDKAMFAIVVSGYSGSDNLTMQLIAALNMNKSFYLPPHFAMMETAFAPGSAMALKDIGKRLDDFADNMYYSLTGKKLPAQN